ncbi:hypothetical protein [Thermococcus sp.]|nr:hypothetical protein [Thermococcus sp.]
MGFLLLMTKGMLPPAIVTALVEVTDMVFKVTENVPKVGAALLRVVGA